MMDFAIQIAGTVLQAFNPTSFLSAPSNVWFPIVALGVLLVMSVVGIIYALAPLLGRNDIRVWAIAKLYDSIITIIFALIFLSFSTMLFAVQPAGLYNSIGLLPDGCNPQLASQNTNIPVQALATGPLDNFYGIASCDIFLYNQYVLNFSDSVFWLSLIIGVAPKFTLFPFSNFGFSLTINTLPIELVHQYMVPLMGAYFSLVIASQVLQLLIGSSMFLFSVFMIVGLIARSFGITRSFGGAMIAFGLGIGFIYPLMISVSYGFLNTVIQNSQYLSLSLTSGCPSIPITMINPVTYVSTIYGVMASVMSAAFSSGGSINVAQIVNPLSCAIQPMVVDGGLIAAGLTVLPLLNLIIVDAFIIDFSRAVGERMDLMSILTRIL